MDNQAKARITLLRHWVCGEPQAEKAPLNYANERLTTLTNNNSAVTRLFASDRRAVAGKYNTCVESVGRDSGYLKIKL